VTAAAIVLAAGRGTRFGGGKMLARVDDRPMLQHVLDLCAAARLTPVVVVLGADADAAERMLSWRAETRLVNPAPERGLASSLQIGFAALERVPGVLRAVILLGDQPWLRASQLAQISAVPGDDERPIVVPRYADGRPGNPVLLERAGWPLVARLEGDRGIAQLFEAESARIRYVDVAGHNPDVDTRSDLAASTRGAGPGQSGRRVAGGRSRPSAARPRRS
jgi:molybdenum cofactor cytidylyltransferase